MSNPNQREDVAPTTALVALFLISATLTTVVLRHVLPGGGSRELVDVKLERFAQTQDEYTVLFLGSSRVHRGFVPSLFDQRTSELGFPTRSFNFGAPGSRAFEVRDLLARIRELGPRQLDFVFVDPEGTSVLRDTRNHRARQVIEWHDPATTLLISEHLWSLDLPTSQKLEALTPHWQSCLYNVANIGAAQLWVDIALGSPRTDEVWLEMTGAQLDGYAPLGEDSEDLGRRGQRFQAKRRASYLEQLETFQEQPLDTTPPSDFALSIFEDIERRVAALDATAIFVAQPAMYHQEDLIAAARLGHIDHLLRYDEPLRFPDLYDPDHRYDETHLNDEGARLFTELLATEFVARVRAGEFRAR